MRWNKLKIDNFNFEAGGSVSNIEVVYHTSNRDYQPGDRVVWLCHALTANSNPMDWWPEMVGKGCFIDPEKDYVVCVNIFASPYGTTGPRSIKNEEVRIKNCSEEPTQNSKFKIQN